MPGGMVRLTQTTEMPWQGAVSIKVDETTGNNYSMMLRLPGWANGAPVPSDLYSYVDSKKADIVVKINGKDTSYEMQDGYMVINRKWTVGDLVSFELPMDIRMVAANELVEADLGRMALERGPFVYCIESPDNANVNSCYLTESATVRPVWTDALNGLMKLNISQKNAYEGENTMTAIPYYA